MSDCYVDSSYVADLEKGEGYYGTPKQPYNTTQDCFDSWAKTGDTIYSANDSIKVYANNELSQIKHTESIPLPFCFIGGFLIGFVIIKILNWGRR